MGLNDEEIRNRSRLSVASEFGPEAIGKIEVCDSISALEALANLALHRVRELSSAKYAGVKHD